MPAGRVPGTAATMEPSAREVSDGTLRRWNPPRADAAFEVESRLAGTRGRRRDGVETLGRRRDGLVPGFGDQQRGRSKRRDGAHRGPTVGSERSNSRANALTRSYPREFEPRLARPESTRTRTSRKTPSDRRRRRRRDPRRSPTRTPWWSRDPPRRSPPRPTRRVWTSVRFSPREAPPGERGTTRRHGEIGSAETNSGAIGGGVGGVRDVGVRERGDAELVRGARPKPRRAKMRDGRVQRLVHRRPVPGGVGDDGVVLFVLSPSGAVLVPRTSRHLAVLDDVPAHDRAVTSRRRTPSYLGRLGRDSREGERLRRVGRRGERSKRARFGRRTKPDVVTRANPRANRLAGIETGHRRARVEPAVHHDPTRGVGVVVGRRPFFFLLLRRRQRRRNAGRRRTRPNPRQPSTRSTRCPGWERVAPRGRTRAASTGLLFRVVRRASVSRDDGECVRRRRRRRRRRRKKYLRLRLLFRRRNTPPPPPARATQTPPRLFVDWRREEARARRAARRPSRRETPTTVGTVPRRSPRTLERVRATRREAANRRPTRGGSRQILLETNLLRDEREMRVGG